MQKDLQVLYGLIPWDLQSSIAVLPRKEYEENCDGISS